MFQNAAANRVALVVVAEEILELKLMDRLAYQVTLQTWTQPRGSAE